MLRAYGDPFYQGGMAHLDGMPRFANPYRALTRCFDRWNLGHLNVDRVPPLTFSEFRMRAPSVYPTLW